MIMCNYTCLQLLLNGRKYSIVPIGEGQWVSQSEYDLSRDLQCKNGFYHLERECTHNIDSYAL